MPPKRIGPYLNGNFGSQRSLIGPPSWKNGNLKFPNLFQSKKDPPKAFPNLILVKRKVFGWFNLRTLMERNKE